MLFNNSLLALCPLVFLLIGFFCYVYLRLFSRGPLPDVLPWVGVNDNGGFLSRARATLKSVTNTREMLQEGYYKYSKKGIPFILPNILTGPEVILPFNQMEWLLQQTDSVLDQNEVNRQFLQANYTMLHPKVIRDTVHAEVIRRELTKQLGDFIGDVVEEVDLAFKQNWGVDSTQWKEVPVYATMSDVIGKLSNRILVGVPLCRNEEYLENSRKFARGVVIISGLICMTPKILKPLLAPVFTLYDRTLYWKCAKYIVPIVRQRTSAPVSDDKDKNDYVQWAIDHASTHRDPAERSPDMISKRLAVLSFAAIQSSAITLTNLIFDLAASPSCPSHLSRMRDEVWVELEAEHGAWTKAGLARMISLDSMLRESMRLWGFVSRAAAGIFDSKEIKEYYADSGFSGVGVLKSVVKKDGVRLPGGLHLPFGTKVGFHAHPIHHDEDLYAGAYKFDPFRWLNEENGDAEGSDFKTALRLGEKRKGTSLVTTSSTFMAFSHGRHACPGRFFASQQLKLTLAYIALNYEIKQIPSRPDNKWFVGSSGPPLEDTIFVRRRTGTAR